MRRYSRLAVSASWLALTILAPAHAGELVQLPGGDSVRAPSGYAAAAPLATEPVAAAPVEAGPEVSGTQDIADAAPSETAEEKRARVSLKPRIGLAEDEPRETSDALARVFSSAFLDRNSSEPKDGGVKEAAGKPKQAAVPAIAPDTPRAEESEAADRWKVTASAPVAAGETLSLMDELALQANAPSRPAGSLDEVRLPGSAPAPQLARAEEAPLKKAEVQETAEAPAPAPLEPVPALPVKTAEIAPVEAPAEDAPAEEPAAQVQVAEAPAPAPARIAEAGPTPLDVAQELKVAEEPEAAEPALKAEAAPAQDPAPAQAETPAATALAEAAIETPEPESQPAPKAEKAAPGWTPEDALAIAGFLTKPEENAEPETAEPAAPILAAAETPAPAEDPVETESAGAETPAVEVAAKEEVSAPPATHTAKADTAAEPGPQAAALAESKTAPAPQEESVPVKAAAIEGAPSIVLDAEPAAKPKAPRPAALLAALSTPEMSTRLLNDLPPAPHSALAPAAAYEGDFTGDGNKDRLVFWRDSNSKHPYADRLPTIYAGDGHGSLQPRALIAASKMLKVPAFVRIADFNMDGRDDILMGSGATEGEALMLWLSGKDGRFHEATEEGVPDHAAWQNPRWQVWGMTTGDIDADGDMDVLVGTQAQMVDYLEDESIVRLFVNDGSGVFYDATDALPAQLRDPALLETGAKQLAHVSLTDMDGDKADDLRAYLPASGEHVVYLNAGFGDFTKSDPIPAHYFAKRDVAGHTGSIAALPFQTTP